MLSALGIVGIGVGAVASTVMVGTTVICVKEVKEAKRLIGCSYDRISKMSNVEVDRELIDRLTNEAVKNKASEAAYSAAEKVRLEIMSDIRSQVRESLKNESERISAKVATEIELANGSYIRDRVIEATVEKLVEKMSETLDKKVANMAKVYSGLAAALK